MVATRKSSMAGRRRCLVTGGAGFLGKHLVEQLLASGGYEVAVFDIRESGDARVSCIVGDLRAPEQVAAATAGACLLAHWLEAVRASACCGVQVVLRRAMLPWRCPKHAHACKGPWPVQAGHER